MQIWKNQRSLKGTEAPIDNDDGDFDIIYSEEILVPFTAQDPTLDTLPVPNDDPKDILKTYLQMKLNLRSCMK